MIVLPPIVRGSSGNVVRCELSNSGLQHNSPGLSIKIIDDAGALRTYTGANIEAGPGSGPPSPGKVRFGPSFLPGIYGLQFEDSLFADAGVAPPCLRVELSGSPAGTFLIPLTD